MPLPFARPRALLAGAALLVLTACILSSTTERRETSAAALAGTTVTSPLRVHLKDGGLIVFDYGADVTRSAISGAGRRFDAVRHASTPAERIALDSVLGIEVYDRRVDPARSAAYSIPATAGGLVLGALAAIAIFGSCPTIYGDSAGVETLQAESFSYSIAPLMAKRDVDRMTIQAGADGVIRLTVKNEALETHYLDHMEVVEVRHGAGELALPSPRNGAIVVSDLAGGASVHDRAGRDVSRLVARADEAAFSTDDRVLDAAIAGGPTDDQLVIAVPRRGADSVALVLKARSSLLTTSVLYEHLMGRQGALALDFMGRDLGRITTLARLAGWYGNNFGMRVEVQDGDGWRQVIRLMDFGPTAWRTVGVALPATRGADDSVRVRLTFAADAFRIDQVALARRVHIGEQRRIPVARAFDTQGKPRTDIVAMLARADDRDVVTHPGERFRIEMDAGAAPGDARTFFFAGQGYYTEWLRPQWMTTATPVPFSPATSPMRELLRSWKGGRDTLEAQFFTRRVPVA